MLLMGCSIHSLCSNQLHMRQWLNSYYLNSSTSITSTQKAASGLRTKKMGSLLKPYLQFRDCWSLMKNSQMDARQEALRRNNPPLVSLSTVLKIIHILSPICIFACLCCILGAFLLPFSCCCFNS